MFLFNFWKSYDRLVFDDDKNLEHYHEIFDSKKELNHLMWNDLKYNNLSHLQKCVTLTRNYPFINEYLIQYLKYYSFAIDYQNDHNGTALSLSSRCSNTKSSIETVKILISYGASVNMKDADGNTPLMYACHFSKTESSDENVLLLLENNANVNLQNNIGNTALMCSLKACNTTSSQESIYMLLKNDKINVNLRNNSGWTALHYAVFYQLHEFIVLLISKNANIKLKTNQGYDILSLCANNDDLNGMLLLLDHFKELPNYDDYEKSPIYISSVIKKNSNILKELLKKKPHVDKRIIGDIISNENDENTKLLCLLVQYGFSLDDIPCKNYRKLTKNELMDINHQFMEIMSEKIKNSKCSVCNQECYVIDILDLKICKNCIRK